MTIKLYQVYPNVVVYNNLNVINITCSPFSQEVTILNASDTICDRKYTKGHLAHSMGVKGLPFN